MVFLRCAMFGGLARLDVHLIEHGHRKVARGGVRTGRDR
jgi:hypothetical protein